jgi:predicted Holliday junction resolvase-like endonuclease
MFLNLFFFEIVVIIIVVIILIVVIVLYSKSIQQIYLQNKRKYNNAE